MTGIEKLERSEYFNQSIDYKHFHMEDKSFANEMQFIIKSIYHGEQ